MLFGDGFYFKNDKGIVRVGYIVVIEYIVVKVVYCLMFSLFKRIYKLFSFGFVFW